MNEERVKRKLSGILSADAVGYSRLMQEDEASTIRTLEDSKRLMSELIEQFKGRVVDAPGDNLLAEFSSVVDATECAVKIQQELKTKNAELPDNRKMEFRIGVNVGDVIVDSDRIYGDGVNIAARVEALAEAGGVCISGRVYDQVENKLDLDYQFKGEHAVKNISKPIRVYQVYAKPDVVASDLGIKIEEPDKPSIAVLPFVNMSGDPSQEYFSDGLTEQIITGISKIRHLLVIARNSAFAYKGKAVKVQRVGKELGVRYVLEGSVQKSGERVRITAQLVDAKSGHHLWAENFDRKLEDVFAIQDDITMKVMDALLVTLTQGEQWRRLAGGTSNFSAFNEFLQGIDYFYRLTKGDNSQARSFFEAAIKIDPNYALAHARLAITYVFDILNAWSKSPQESLEQAENSTNKAFELNDSLDWAYMVLTHIHLFRKQHERAIAAAEQAISLNPNGAAAHLLLGIVLNFTGRSKEAIELTKKAIRLNPIPEDTYLNNMAWAYMGCEQYEKAIGLLKKVIPKNPDFLAARVALTTCLSLSGLKKEALESAKELLKMNPNFSLDFAVQWARYKNKSDLERMIEALSKAGIPEHSPKE